MDVTMPQLGETVTEGTITRWLKRVGDRVEADEPLFEVSTEKVDTEVPAPASGWLAEIRVPEGETVPVGAVLAVLGDTAPATRSEPAAERPQEAEQPLRLVEQVARAVPPAPAAPEGPVPREPAEGSASPAEHALTSPVVRRLMAEHGLEVAQVRGTGEGGRITRQDVLAAARVGAAPPSEVEAPERTEAPRGPSPAAPTPAAPTPAATVVPPPVVPSPPVEPPGAGDEIVPFSNIRRRTAEHMVRSLATSAHVYTSVEVDFERVERVRVAHQRAWKEIEGFTLTYLPFIARAFCDTVDDFPHVNASISGDSLVVHHDVHLAIAVDLDSEGLVAPVIRSADGKRLRVIAHEIRDLAERARSRQLVPDEVLGGTFTITNPGPFGSYLTLPIINQPQVAILSTDGVHKRPVVVQVPDGSDVIAVRHVGILALAWDHRAFDGAYASSFLRQLKQVLETRDWEAELD